MERSSAGFVAMLSLCACAALPALASGCHTGDRAPAGGHGGHGTSTGPATGAGGHGGGSGETGGKAAGGWDGGADPCAGVTCSGQGTCGVSMAQAACACNAGFHAVGLTCVADETCGASTCGNCATCQVVDGLAQCTCPAGYVLQGKDCQLSPDPCATTTCAPDQACVSQAHCQPLGACVQTCDCSNCPNCGPGADWSTEQEYCGASTMGPATLMCNTPCAGGEGCLPYSPGICWPLEGCFSL